MIFQYTDEQAQDDGVLVKVGGPSRVTRSVFDLLAKHIQDDTVLAYCDTWIKQYQHEAKYIYKHNLGGGIWTGALLCAPVPVLRPMAKPEGQEIAVWIMPNEQGGLTLMLPEDY